MRISHQFINYSSVNSSIIIQLIDVIPDSYPLPPVSVYVSLCLSVSVCSIQDPVAICSAICSKPLHCGHHRCPLTCHHSACAPCPDKVPVSCQCGKETQMVPCVKAFPLELTEEGSETAAKPLPHLQFRCQKRCHAKRNCGRHRYRFDAFRSFFRLTPDSCGIRCCDGRSESHRCDLICKRPLKCVLR